VSSVNTGYPMPFSSRTMSIRPPWRTSKADQIPQSLSKGETNVDFVEVIDGENVKIRNL